jgi:hypothetical protein
MRLRGQRHGDELVLGECARPRDIAAEAVVLERTLLADGTVLVVLVVLLCGEHFSEASVRRMLEAAVSAGCLVRFFVLVAVPGEQERLPELSAAADTAALGRSASAIDPDGAPAHAHPTGADAASGEAEGALVAPLAVVGKPRPRPRVEDAVVLGVRALDADELLRPPALPEYITEELQWRAGRPAMVVGPRGSGKTLAIQSAALSLASGARNIWGHIPVGRRTRVLHLDQGGGMCAARRYQRLALGLGLSAEDLRDHLRLVAGPRIKLTDPRARDAYGRAVEGWHICILDPLGGFMTGLDDSDSRVGDYVDEILTPLSEDTGCAFVVLHDGSSVHENGRWPFLRFAPVSRDVPAASGLSTAKHLRTRGHEGIARELRRVTMGPTAPAPRGKGLAPFLLEFVDVPGEDGENPQAGLSVIHRAEEDVKVEARADHAVMNALRYLRECTLAGHPVCGIEALAKAIQVHRRTAGDAVRRLERAKLVVNEPERVGRGAAKPRFYACSSIDFARPRPVRPCGASR